MIIKIYSFFCWVLSFLFSKPLIMLVYRVWDKVLYYGQKRYYNKKLKSSGGNISLHEPNTVKGLEYISIGNNFKSGKYLTLEAWDFHNGTKFSPEIVIGNNVSLGMFCHIACINKIEIEDNVLIAGKVFISDHSHGTTEKKDVLFAPNERTLFSKGAICIKRNVWIGENVSILPGVTIGENAIIGANSVVTHNIPDNSVAVGCPAKVAKKF